MESGQPPAAACMNHTQHEAAARGETHAHAQVPSDAVRLDSQRLPGSCCFCRAGYLVPPCFETEGALGHAQASKEACSFVVLFLDNAHGGENVLVCLQVDAFKEVAPLAAALRAPGMRQRHWEQLSAQVSRAVQMQRAYRFLINLGDDDSSCSVA